MKLMKLLYINLIIIGFLLLFNTGCKRALDINQNPNVPSLDQGNPALVLPAAQLATAAKEGGDLAIIGGLWGEYVAQAALSIQYANYDSYNIQPTEGTNNAVYFSLYVNALKNYQYVVDKAQASGDWNFYLMGTVMKAYTAELLVDLYDKIPYTEALKGSANLNPHFDDGYTVYVDVLNALDSALSKDFTASTNSVVGNEDLVFQGDMNKWKQFANTLELKMYLRMINAKPQEAMAGVQKLYTANAQFLSSDAGIFGFKDIPSEDNPLYEQNIRSLNTSTNLRASETFVSFLEANNDPRIVTYFGSTTPAAINQGDYQNTTNPVYRAAAVLVENASDPVVFISAAESYFMQAEARERYFNGDQAQALYNQGVLISFTDEGQDGTSFVAQGGAYAYPVNGTLDQKIQAISTQKWASFPYGVHFIEGYFEKQRTGYPLNSAVYSNNPNYIPGQFVTSANSVLPSGQLPRRLPIPNEVTERNPNAPPPVPITTPVWWAKP